MTYFIAIGSQKGGVAKTTTCVSLGACLADRRKTVMLVDLDPQANLTMSLGIEPKSLRWTVSDVVLYKMTPVSVSLRTEISGLDLLPANSELATVDKALYRAKHYETYLREAMATLNGSNYDYVLIDCAPSYGPLMQNALTVADLVIVPTQAEYYAAHSLGQYLKLIEMVRQKTNPALRYRILVTMYDQRNQICVRVLELLRHRLSDALFETTIQIDTQLCKSSLAGKPVTRYRPHTRGAQQYRALAEELESDEHVRVERPTL